MRSLGLDCLTLPDVTPAELVRVAARAGYRYVSLWVQAPALYEPMLATPAQHDDIAAAVAETGVTIGNLEVFNLNIDDPVSDYEPQLAFGASLGATSATAINFGARRDDIPERLAQFHALCAKLGLKAFVEPITMGITRTQADGVRLIEQAGVDAQLVVDLLHVMRTGGSPETLAAIPAHRIGHVQICDGPLVIPAGRIGIEAIADRLYPGEGKFPIAAFMPFVPAHASVGLETPNLRRLEAGVSPLDRVREGLVAMRALPGQDG